MPSGESWTFTDPDALAQTIRKGSVEIILTERGLYTAKFVRVDLYSLHLQRYSHNLARIARNDGQNGGVYIVFQTLPGAVVVRDGVELSPTSVSLAAQNRSFYNYSAGPSSFANVYLKSDSFLDFSATILGYEVAAPIDPLSITPSSDAMARLQQLHAAASILAEDAPAVLAHPEAARGLEEALIGAIMDCLASAELEEERASQRQHAAIMRRFRRTIEDHIDEPLYLPELCKEVGTSVRTLNTCCQEHLGMSAKRYLLVRRMNMVRRALRQSAPADTTVTEVSTRYGFWQLGRLAVEYKGLFGESPSATLTRVE